MKEALRVPYCSSARTTEEETCDIWAAESPDT